LGCIRLALGNYQGSFQDLRLEPCAAPPPPNFLTRAAAEIFNRHAECRRRRNFWSAPAQIGGAAGNATVAERQSVIFL